MPVAVAPLSYADISGWLTDLLNGVDTDNFPAFNQGPYIPELPNELVTITLSSGAGYAAEGAIDQTQFQLRVRSEQNSQTTADTQSALLDKLIFEARFPTKLRSGMNLLLVSRVGGGPSALGPPDAAQRFDYVCSYNATVGVSL